jgi:hypothetical protein
VSLFIREAGVVFVCAGKSSCGMNCEFRVNFYWRVIWSSRIRAKLKASFKECGLNILIPSAISDLRPPINISTGAFCVHPPDFPTFQTLFGNLIKNQPV